MDFGLEELVRLHRSVGALVSIAVVQVENAGRFGTVTVDSDRRIIGFKEKSGSEASGLINGGVYVIDSSVLELIPEGPASLELDIFPRLIGKGLCAVQQRGVFIDIGTPQDFARAQARL